MGVQILQDILVVLFAGYVCIDNAGIAVFNAWAVVMGMVTGIIMGDMTTGLLIGGTFQLMSLGVAGIGGSSVPDYGFAALVGTFLAVRTGSGLSTAVAVGLPVGLLVLNFDVLVKILNNFIAHKMQTFAHEKKFNKMRLIGLLGPLMFGLKNMIVMVIIVIAGPSTVKTILAVIPKWVTNGLNIAGGMLPVLGIALLMHYMPLKKYSWAMIIGFALSVYLKVPIIGISLIGAAGAIIVYQSSLSKLKSKAVADANVEVEDEGDDYDE